MNTNFKPRPYGTKSIPTNDSLSVSLPPTTREVEMSVTGMPSSSKSMSEKNSVSAYYNTETKVVGVSATGTPSIIIAGAIGLGLGIGGGCWLYSTLKNK